MARTIRTHFDFGKVGEIRNAMWHLLSSDPSSPVEGQFYHNTATHRPKIYDGTSFRQLITAAEKVTDLTTPTSAFAMGAQKITGLGLATAGTDAASLANKLTDFAVPTSALLVGSQKISNVADGTAATDAATYGQLLTLQNGMDWKSSVRAATTGALPANTYSAGVLTATSNGALAAQDGVTLAVNERLLVKNEATAKNNGLYFVSQVGTGGTPYTLTRCTDADTTAKITPNLTVAIEEGTTLADTWWQITTNAAITLDTTGLTFAQIGQGTTYIGGAGLTLTGATFDVVAAGGSGIIVNADNIDIDPTNGLPVNRGGTGGITAAAAKTNLSFMTRFASTIGDGSTTAIVVTHNLNTRDVVTSVHDATTFDEIQCDVQKTSVNTVTFTFASAPATNAYRAIVLG